MEKVVHGLRGNITPGGGAPGDVLNECAGDAMLKLRLHEYFNVVRSHDSVFNTDHDVITFYCGTPHKISGGCGARREFLATHAPQEVYLDCDAASNTISNVFYDTPGRGVSFELSGATDIYVNNYYAGTYFAHNNVLCATDWTHDSSCVRAFAQIWPELVQELGLCKLPHVQVKRKRNSVPITQITVGCDPEYEIVQDDGTVVNARYVVSGMSGAIGLDGAGNQVELRPSPGTPRDVVGNIRGLLQQFVNTYKMKLSTNGNRYPLGGHVHVGVGKAWAPPEDLLTMLDAFVGEYTLPLSGDARGGYAQHSAYETKPWGFEYRTPPAAVFANPTITRITLKLVRNIVHKFINAGTIKYNSPPTQEDFVRVAGLSKREASTFFDFVHTHNKYANSGALFAAWRVKAAPRKQEKNKVTFCLRDHWLDVIRTRYTSELSDVYSKTVDTVVLYGLANSHGCVATIPIPSSDIGCTTYKPHVDCGRTLYIGLPYELRAGKGGYGGFVHPHVPVIAAIKDYVKNYKRVSA